MSINYRPNNMILRVFATFFLTAKAISIVSIKIKPPDMYKRNEERMRIARNIKLIRELRNFDQHYVASELSVARSTISTWENGISEVRIETLVRLAEIFRLDDYRQIIDFDPDALFTNSHKDAKEQSSTKKIQ